MRTSNTIRTAVRGFLILSFFGFFLICQRPESVAVVGAPCKFDFDCGWGEFCYGVTTFESGICMPKR
jgi:hypothetical protein